MDCIAKPFQHQEVVARIGTHLRLQSLQRSLQKQNEELKELDRIKSEFLSTASHELRTPLTPIKGFLENILSGMYGEVTEKQKIRTEMALACVSDEARLVENLLDLVRIQENRVELNAEPGNMADIVQSVIQVFDYDAGGKGVGLKADIQDKEGLVM